jgi:hypothetical protein
MEISFTTYSCGKTPRNLLYWRFGGIDEENDLYYYQESNPGSSA